MGHERRLHPTRQIGELSRAIDRWARRKRAPKEKSALVVARARVVWSRRRLQGLAADRPVAVAKLPDRGRPLCLDFIEPGFDPSNFERGRFIHDPEHAERPLNE